MGELGAQGVLVAGMGQIKDSSIWTTFLEVRLGINKALARARGVVGLQESTSLSLTVAGALLLFL